MSYKTIGMYMSKKGKPRWNWCQFKTLRNYKQVIALILKDVSQGNKKWGFAYRDCNCLPLEMHIPMEVAEIYKAAGYV